MESQGLLQRGKVLVLNDRDDRLIQLFRVCRDHSKALANEITFTPYSRTEHKKAQTITGAESDLELARKYLIDCFQSFKYQNGDTWGYTLADDKGLYAWSNIPDRLINAASLLKRCYLENSDFEVSMRRWDREDTLHYCDAPYLGKEKYYDCRFAREDHDRLAQCAHEMKGQVIVSYYPHPEITRLYPEADWEHHLKETIAHSCGITKGTTLKSRPKRQELLLIRKSKNPTTIALSGQMNLFS